MNFPGPNGSRPSGRPEAPPERHLGQGWAYTILSLWYFLPIFHSDHTIDGPNWHTLESKWGAATEN